MRGRHSTTVERRDPPPVWEPTVPCFLCGSARFWSLDLPRRYWVCGGCHAPDPVHPGRPIVWLEVAIQPTRARQQGG